jgi:hypothetical protein
VPDATEQPTDGTADAPAADSHGACVSAAVHAAQAAPLAEGQNRGSAVSAAAHSCPKTDAAETETDQESADDSVTAPQQEAAKPARTKAHKAHKTHKAHKAAHARKAHGKK